MFDIEAITLSSESSIVGVHCTNEFENILRTSYA